MSKFEHIFQDHDKLLGFSEDLERVANKYGLTFDTCIEEYGALVIYFDKVNSDGGRPKGKWELLDDCSNEGVYCSICHKKVYRKEYANQKVKSKFCPNCGADMRGDVWTQQSGF